MTTADIPLQKPTRIRFLVLFFICSLSMLTYLDRVCISRVQEDIQSDLGFSSEQMGLVFGAFALGYCLFEVPGGWMGDVWGSRRVLTRIVLWWSLFTGLTGSVDWILNLGIFGATTPFMLLAGMILVRFLFGCGEAGAYPNLARVVGSWFPFRERALAQGGIWMCARLGGAIAPFVIGRLSSLDGGWRQAFWALAYVGFAWTVFFYLWFRNTPAEHPGCNAAERDLIGHGRDHVAELAHPWPPWGTIFTSMNVWALGIVAFTVSFGWYFYPTWQPKYLKDVHNVSFANSEILSGLPFLFGAFGALLGGQISDLLVRRIGRRWGRSLIGFVGFTGAGSCVLATGFATSQTQAVALLCLAFFINDLAIPPLWAASTDIGGKYAGTVSGVMNMAGGVGAILSPILTPIILNLLPEEWSHALRWRVIFIGLAGAWFIGAVAWLRIDAGSPIESANHRTPPLPAA